MTPERKEQLMREAANALKAQWGEIQPEALHRLMDDLRIGIIEDGTISGSEIAQRALDADLFGREEAVSEKERERDALER